MIKNFDIDKHMKKVHDAYYLKLLYRRTDQLESKKYLLEEGYEVRKKIFIRQMSKLLNIDQEYLRYHEQYSIHNDCPEEEIPCPEKERDCHQVVLTITTKLSINEEFFKYMQKSWKTTLAIHDWSTRDIKGINHRYIKEDLQYSLYFTYIPDKKRPFSPKIKQFFEDGTFNEKKMLKNIGGIKYD